ncbi:putative lipoprotein [Ahrensia sp. R2A130]|nr:putative lipoprotein [Ahrensia sp. R2A130]
MMKMFTTATMLLAAAALAGCTGASTYGTGKNQSAETLTGITDMLSIGAPGRTKTVIDYSARPKLVKAPSDGSLPTPAETVSTSDGYFPVDPEARRARLRAEAAEGGAQAADGDSPELLQMKAEARERAKLDNRPDYNMIVDDRYNSEPYSEIVKKREARGKRQAELAKLGAAPKARKYLTQPPTEYRVPSDTAPIGELGEEEVDPNRKAKRNKSGAFRDIFGG